MKKFKKICCIFITTMLTLAYCPISISAEDKIVIQTVEDFKNFANDAQLDSWSKEKVVVLENDLDFAQEEFISVPYFLGTFDGQGHTLSNIRFYANTPNQGVFRYLGEAGSIKNLKVEVTISGKSDIHGIGAIVGENRGKIIDCEANAEIDGDAILGGIAGINQSSGEIINCLSRGILTSEQYTGGIVGKNYGSIIRCSNLAQLNTSSQEAVIDIDEIDMNHITTNLSEETHPISGHSDTGGIAGYSSGIIQGCSNDGKIGYPHMGYNVGGIVGRQAGYLSDCENRGTIYGRKDVGGIVGQMEPSILLAYSQNSLNQLKNDLNQLQAMIDNALDHNDQSIDSLNQQINALADSTLEAKDYSHQLLQASLDFMDESIDEVNRTSVQIVELLDDASRIAKDLEKAAHRIDHVLDALDKVVKKGSQLSDDNARLLQSLEKFAKELSLAKSKMSQGLKEIQEALELLSRNAALEEDFLGSAMNQLKSGIQDYASGFEQASESVGVLKELNIEDETLDQAIDDIESNGQIVKDELDQVGELIPTVPSINDFSNLLEALAKLSEAFKTLHESSTLYHQAMNQLEQAFDHLKDINEDVDGIFSATRQVIKEISKQSDYMVKAMGKTTKLLEKAGNFDPLTLPNVDESFRQNTDSLNQSLTDMGQYLKNINNQLADSSQLLNNDLRSISNQFTSIMQTLINALSENPKDLVQIEDTSNEDIQSSTEGKVKNSRNYGNVEGDVNVGGISGAMAIEVSLDPEDDLTSQNEQSLHLRFETKAVMLECQNYGSILAKKNNVGGLVGRMDLGTISGCESYGDVESSNGKYIGGIAGSSASSIQNSYAKANVSGSSYVGGIAGEGHEINQCYSLVVIKNAEGLAGAIAGHIEDLNGLSNNYFIHQGIAGIDGISYSKKAEPISMDELKEKNMPKDFMTFTLTYYIDGKQIAQIPFEYGDDLSSYSLPDIPKKEGYYGEWPEFDYTIVKFSQSFEAIYKPWISVISSEAKANGKALALAEGNFSERADITAQMVENVALPNNVQPEKAQCIEVKLNDEAMQENEVHQIRLLKPELKRCQVYQMIDGTWQLQSSHENGSYIQVEMEGQEAVFCVVVTSNLIYWVIGGIAVIGCTLIGVILYRKKNKTKKDEVKEQE